MCDRYSLAEVDQARELAALLGAGVDPSLAPSLEITPGTLCPVFLPGAGHAVLTLAHWGLRMHGRTMAVAPERYTETWLRRLMYGRGRCVIPADAFRASTGEAQE